MKKLTNTEINFLIKILKSGNELPLDYKHKLFPTKQKEYELAYAGKMRKEDLFANEDGVFPVPLQIEKNFNNEEYEAFDDGWKNIIVFGDNLQFLKTIYENKDPLIKDKVKGKVKLIYIDPPFGTGDQYDGNKGQSAYSAKRKGADFVEFLRRRLILAREILADDGSIFVRLDYHFGHYIKLVLDEVFGKENFRNEIIINRTQEFFKSPGINSKKYMHDTDSLYFFSKFKNGVFNQLLVEREDAVWWEPFLPSKNKPKNDFRIVYENKIFSPIGRKWGLKQSDIEILEKNERIKIINSKVKYSPQYRKLKNNWTDIPGYSRTVNYPTENSEILLERVIKTSTNEGDIVVDFFGGSGTTMAVAEKLGRKWITCDIGKLAHFTMQKRILRIQDSKDLENTQKKYDKKAKSFITARLGTYNLKQALDLEWQKYQKFVAGLFEVELAKNKIAGLEFDGKKGDYPVEIFDYRKFKDSSIDESYLKEMHAVIGRRTGGRVYIIAPINFVDFLTDYYEIGNIRYYFLKIPYQMIRELHKTPFQKLRQPQSKKNVNDLDEAVGFHFIRSPEVRSKLKKNKNEVKILIESFESNELQSEKLPDEKSMKGFETLSAVFVDKNYNGKTFEMDEAFFANELPKKEISFKRSELGSQLMVVWTDIYGNDFTEIFKVG